MGMYTELNVKLKFNKDTPKDVIKAIKFMESNDLDPNAREIPADIGFDTSHALFKTERWDWMFRSGDSFEYKGSDAPVTSFVEVKGQWVLTLRRSIKNYTGEWEEFLNFTAPHCQDGVVGTWWYEEAEQPSSVHFQNGRYELVRKPKEIEIVGFGKYIS